MTLKIAVVGHTNSGKTTLIRTLLRRPVGEVDDRANVTQLAGAQEFEDFYAKLVDTPGFQNAGGYLAFLKMRETYGDDAAKTIKILFRWNMKRRWLEQSQDAMPVFMLLLLRPSQTMQSLLKLIWYIHYVIPF